MLGLLNTMFDDPEFNRHKTGALQKMQRAGFLFYSDICHIAVHLVLGDHIGVQLLTGL